MYTTIFIVLRWGSKVIVGFASLLYMNKLRYYDCECIIKTLNTEHSALHSQTCA